MSIVLGIWDTLNRQKGHLGCIDIRTWIRVLPNKCSMLQYQIGCLLRGVVDKVAGYGPYSCGMNMKIMKWMLKDRKMNLALAEHKDTKTYWQVIESTVCGGGGGGGLKSKSGGGRCIF